MSSILQPVDPNERLRLRRRQRRRQVRLRRLGAAALLLALIGGGVAGAVIASHIHRHSPPVPAAVTHTSTGPRLPAYPAEVRGVHVTMALAGLPQRLNQYLAMKPEGLNTLEVDVKDESGAIAFTPAAVPLARAVGAAGSYYNPRELAREVHAAGLYLIGRVVVFEDPRLSAGDPELAVRRTDGSRWLSNAGLGWTNPYDHRVWRYNVAIAVAAAKAGFDEIQFDYARFPSDGDLSQIIYPGAHLQPMRWTIPAFLRFARAQLHPLGVRVSADLFGLAATRDLGIGQLPRRLAPYLDSIYAMVYPSHYGSGEYGIVDPNSRPGTTVAYSLRDFRTQLQGRKTNLIAWLQDFSLGRTYTLSDVQDEIQSARLEHVKGFMLWNPYGLYTVRALRTPAFH